jgi:hypothetical protein
LFIPIVLEDGFIRSSILMLDYRAERTTMLLECIKEHNGAHFLHLLKEFEDGRLESHRSTQDL